MAGDTVTPDSSSIREAKRNLVVKGEYAVLFYDLEITYQAPQNET